MKKLMLFLALPFFTNCSRETENPAVEKEAGLLKWDTLITICDSLNLPKQNSLIIHYNNEEFRFNYLDCFSKKVGDTIILNLVRGFGPVDYLSIRVVDSQFTIDYSREGERYSSKFNKLKASMFFCPDKITFNDTTNFYVTYKGIWSKETGSTDTVEIKGNFKAKIHGINYDYETYRFERDSLKMVRLMNQEDVDTIKELNFSRCGLKYLPIEISKFNNLEYLTLDLNDLSMENFRLLVKLKKLKYLSIQRCNISTFPNFLLEISSLEELNISSNKIVFIPKEILVKENMQTLDIRGNKGIRVNDLLKNNINKIEIKY